jgi:lipopolysaccharide transport system ATP-binding protein
MLNTSDVLISLDRVGVCYKGLSGEISEYWALTDVSFDVVRGQTVGIIGNNGAGKSTLMRLLAGVIEPDKGYIKNNNASTQLLSLQIGFDRNLNGRDNAVYSGMLLGKSRREMKSLLPDIIEFAGLGRFIDESVRTYSSGMKARLGFAISCHVKPDILLIDEALGVGDNDFRAKSTAVMKSRIKSDQTVVIVSHEKGALLELCDKLVWIENGVTQMQGDAKAVYAAYEDQS